MRTHVQTMCYMCFYIFLEILSLFPVVVGSTVVKVNTRPLLVNFFLVDQDVELLQMAKLY